MYLTNGGMRGSVESKAMPLQTVIDDNALAQRSSQLQTERAAESWLLDECSAYPGSQHSHLVALLLR